jgi:hypothetical protein
VSLTQEGLAGHHIYVVASGAGTTIQDRLWMIPGASGFLVGAAFPYAMDDTDEFLGFKPDNYCSRKEALQLAMEAYMRAARHSIVAGSGKPVGLAITASVASILGAPHRGEHRVHAAVVTSDTVCHVKVTLDKGAGKDWRRSDNFVSENMAADLLSLVVSLNPVEALQHFYSDDVFETVSESELRDIFFEHPYFHETGRRGDDHGTTGPACIWYPGSFNPLHDGHRALAMEAWSADTTYMIGFDSVHKPSMTVTEALRRAAQFRKERLDGCPGNVLFTQGDPLFVDKFGARPQSTFLMGVDTFERMMDPKWGVDPLSIIETILDNHVELVVNDRIIDGQLVSAEQALEKYIYPNVPPAAQVYFHSGGAPASDLSSSAIRAAKKG